MKRFLALVLSCVMLLTLCPTAWAVEATETDVAVGDGVLDVPQESSVGADDSVRPEEPVLTAPTLGAGATYHGSLGTNVTWTLDTASGELTISGTGAMTNYSIENTPLWNYYSYIKSAVIESGVTTVGNYVFYGCTNLTSVSIPAGVTTIGSYAFYNCNGLTSVTIPAGVTSIGDSAFYSCSSLTSVSVPNSVTSIGYEAFQYCYGLTSVTIGSGVISIGSYAFYRCSSLTSVTIPAGVTSIGRDAFYFCRKLTRVDITDLAAWCGISFGGDGANPLYYAKNLYLNGELVTDLVIPGTVSTVGRYAFYNCTSITSVYIPQSVKSIGQDAFYGNTGLKTVRYAGSQDDWLKIQIGSDNVSLTALTPAFNEAIEGYCRITAQAGDHGTVTADTMLAKAGDTVTLFALPDGGYAVDTYLVNGQPIEGNTFTATADTVVSATFTKIYDVTASGDCGANVKWALDTEGTLHIYGTGAMTNYNGNTGSPWYEYCNSITSAIIEPGVTTVGNFAFYCCHSLTAVSLPDSVIAIGSDAFYYCDDLMSVSLPASLITIGSYAFTDCFALTSVTIPNSVTSIGDSAFSYCKRLTAAGFLGNAPTVGTNVFSGCASSFIIIYHGNTTGWTSPTWNGYKAACNDPIPAESYTTLDENNRNGQGIYFALNTVSHTATVGKNTTETNNSGYYGGQDGEVVIPDTVTKGETTYQVIGINQYAFANFDRVASVSLGRYLSAIEPSAFQGCANLTGFTVDENNLQYAAPGGVLFDKESLYLYVYPAGKPGTAYQIPASCDTIGTKAFYGAKNLTKLTVPGTVQNIGAMAFSGCDGLTEITLPFIGGNAKDTNRFNYVFGSDGYSSYGGVPANLKKVTVLTANLTSSAFNNCINIEEIDLPNCSELTAIPYNCFSYCKSLIRVAFGGQTTDGVVIPDSVTEVGSGAFYCCQKLPAMTLGKGVRYIASQAFYGCTAIETFAVDAANSYFTADKWGVLYSKDMTILRYYPSARSWPYYNVSNSTTSIAESAFTSCGNLVNLFIPKTVTTFDMSQESYGYYNYGYACITNCPGMTVCCYKGSGAAGYAISHSLTAWYMDNYTMQGLNITSLPEMLTYSVQGTPLNAPYVTATYGDKELQVDDYQLTLQKAYGQQTVTVTSGDKSMEFETTVLRTGDINGNSSVDATNVDVTDMACLYDYTSTGVNTGDIEDEAYFQAVADVNGDGVINILDYQKLYEMIR